MTTSSTSITIKWANSKLAETLRKREEEEALLRGNRVRSRDDTASEPKLTRRAQRAAQGGVDMPTTQRWTGSVDYTKPSPLRDRPKSDTGATSFHFKVTQISKEVAPTVGNKVITGFSSASSSPGADHELYIGRELAAERADDIEAYLSRSGAVEIDDAVLERQQDRAYADEINEGFDDLAVATDSIGIPSIFSNISGDALERAEFWRAVHRSEREPRVQTILIDANKDPALVRRMMEDDTLPGSFRELAALAYQDAEAPKDIDAPRVRPRAWQGDAEACGKVLARLQTYQGFDARRSGISYKSGRGGTVQHRLVAELPHELTAAERAALVLQFCRHLERIEENEDGTTRGLMYTAAIHAPDAHNDERNYHLHVVFHDRPAKILEGYGLWDFEVAEAFERKGEIRTRYPFRQDKLRMVRGLNEGTNPEMSGRNFIPGLRREFSRITNEALERAGIERRYDPRTYKAMGIERTPTEHLGTKAAALEAAGVETTVGSLNAMKIWSDAERDIERKTSQRKSAIEKREAILLDLMGKGTREPSAAEAMTKLRVAVSEWSRTATDVVEDSALVEGFDLMEAKARSRAEKVRATCLRTLADIQIGTASSRDVRAKAKIEKRYHDATAWLAQIDAALEQGRPDIEKARAKITRDEERTVELSGLVDRLADDLRKALAEARAAAAKAPTKPAPVVAVTPTRKPIEGLVDMVDIRSLDDEPARPVAPRGIATPAAPDVPSAAPPAAPEPAKPVEPAKPAPAPAPAPAAPSVPPVAAKQAPEQKAPAAPEKAQPATQTPAPAAAPVAAPVVPAKPVETKASNPPAPTPAAPAPAVPDKVVPPPVVQQPAAPAAPEPVVPKPVQPSQPAEPALFDLPVQAAPKKQGSPAERHDEWDRVFNKVQADNLIILPVDGEEPVRLTVPSLTDEERRILETPHLAKRTQARLLAMKETQDHAVGRLGKWIEANGHNEAAIRIRDRKLEFVDTPKAIQTLFERYRRHPVIVPALEKSMETQSKIREVVEWIRTEGRDPENLILGDGRGEVGKNVTEIRETISEVRQYQPVRDALRAEYNRRVAEADRSASERPVEISREPDGRVTYNVDAIRDPLVREFATGLNEQRDPERMHDIAKQIAITRGAREELALLGPEAELALGRAKQSGPIMAPQQNSFAGMQL